MKVRKNTVVSLTYELKVNNDEGSLELVEKVDENQPMVFIFGSSGLPEKFEAALDGKETGETFKIELATEEAYGDYEEEAIVKLPQDVFKIDGKFTPEDFPEGSMVPMSDQDGNMMRGRVVEVDNEGILMDFNHPLAGHDLHFEGTIINVRMATPDELDHGHVHGPGGHHH
jgi:FKBP-type peptidyl-prolyl cis-trans isomerase SlyD